MPLVYRLAAPIGGLLAAVLASACETGGARPQLVVLAASSLTESLTDVAAMWTARGNPGVTFRFDASSRLARQIEAGSPGDLYFSADTGWMDYLDARGLVQRASRVNLFGNTLVAIVPAGAPVSLLAPADLAEPGIRHLALAGEHVPAGRYARAALQDAEAWPAVQARVVNGDSVRTVLSWVATGEAQAGVVYATDARVEPKVQIALHFPPTSHPPIVYPAAVLAETADPAPAAAFLEFCQSVEGMAIFEAAGFTPPGAPSAPTP